jgi:hypothetical protein
MPDAHAGYPLDHMLPRVSGLELEAVPEPIARSAAAVSSRN